MNQREIKKKTYVKTAAMSAAVIFSALAFAVGGSYNNNIASATSSEEEQQHQKTEIAPRLHSDNKSCHIEVEVPEGEEVEPVANTELVEREEVEPATTEVVEKNAENDVKAEVIFRADPAAAVPGMNGSHEILLAPIPCDDE